MAVAAWIFYGIAKEQIGDNTIDLDLANEFQMHLFTSASNASLTTLTTLGSLTNELSSARGYTLSGKNMTQTWSVGASVGETRFDASAVVWTASGGNLGSASAGTNTKFAVIVVKTGDSAKNSANKLLCWSKLSTSGFDVTDGNTLTITPDATNGIFELN